MSFANFIRENSGGIHQVEGQFKMAKNWNCFWKFFIFENFSTWAGCPWELGHLKNLCVFPPSLNAPSSLRSSFFRALSSPYFLSSAPSSPWPSKVVRFLTLPLFWVCLRALTSSERAFEPSLHFERAFEPLLPFRARLWALVFFSSTPLSPRFPSSAPLSPCLLFKHAFEPSLSFRARLWALDHSLECTFEPSHSFECAFEPSFSLFFTWVGHPSQRDPFFVFFHLGRSPITMRPLLKKKQKIRSSSKWLVSWFLHLSVKVVCQSTVFKVFKTKKKKNKKKQKFFLYLLFFIHLLHKAKRKWNFLISLHSKYYKEGATVIT